MDIEAAVNGFVRHVILLVAREQLLEPASNLFWRPLQLELAGNHVGQHAVLRQLTRFGAPRLIPSMLIRLSCTICFAATIALEFPADGRWCASEASGQRADGYAGNDCTRYLLALGQCQGQSGTASLHWPYATRFGQNLLYRRMIAIK
ncbi:hypothetical protein D3C85_1142690 [compost metagenome]